MRSKYFEEKMYIYLDETKTFTIQNSTLLIFWMDVHGIMLFKNLTTFFESAKLTDKMQIIWNRKIEIASYPKSFLKVFESNIVLHSKLAMLTWQRW